MSLPRNRIGSTCLKSGFSKQRCPCPSCVDYRDELATWNARLHGKGLAVVKPRQWSPKAP